MTSSIYFSDLKKYISDEIKKTKREAIKVYILSLIFVSILVIVF